MLVDKMTSSDKQVADAVRQTKIKRMARFIRKEYLSLKLGKSEKDEILIRVFKPMTAPLTAIAQKIKTTNCNYC